MSCDNVITVQDLETDKKHSTFYREVITGKAGGTGANIDYATNVVTGQVQKTLPKILDDLDWSYVGLFADGVTFTDKTDFAVDAVGTQWIYTGSLPFSATAGTVPSEPTYQAVHVKSASAISNANGGSVQDFIDNSEARDGIKNLLTIANVPQTVTGFYSGTDIGGGDFVYRPNLSKDQHNGVTVIAPEALAAWDGTYSDIDTLFNHVATGLGCFVRVGAFPTAVEEIPITWAGAVPNSKSAKSLQQIVNICQKSFDTASGNRQMGIIVPNGAYLIETTITAENAYNFVLRGTGKRYGSSLVVDASISESSPLWAMFRFGSGFVKNVQFCDITMSGNNRAVMIVDHSDKFLRSAAETGDSVTYQNCTISGIKDGGCGIHRISYDSRVINCEIAGFGSSASNAGQWRGIGVVICGNSNGCNLDNTWFKRLSCGVYASDLDEMQAVHISNSIFDNIRGSAIFGNCNIDKLSVNDCYFEGVNSGLTNESSVASYGGQSGSGCVLSASLSSGRLVAITVTSGGSGYTAEPWIRITGDGFGATARAVVSGGVVTSVTVVNGGWGYTTLTASARDCAAPVSSAILLAANVVSSSFAYPARINVSNNLFKSCYSDSLLAISGALKTSFCGNRIPYKGSQSGTEKHSEAVRVFGYGIGTSLGRASSTSLRIEQNDYFSNTPNRLGPSVQKILTASGLQAGGRYLNGIVINDSITQQMPSIDTLIDGGNMAFFGQNPNYTAAYNADKSVLTVTKNLAGAVSTISLKKHLEKVRGNYIRVTAYCTGSTTNVSALITISDGIQSSQFDVPISAGSYRQFDAPFYVDPLATNLTISYESYGAVGSSHSFRIFNVIPANLEIGSGRMID